MRLARASAAVALAAACTSLTDASASVSIALPFDALVRSSTAAAFVTPVEQTAMWEAGRIVTYTGVHIDAQVAGEPLSDEAWVRTLGGEVGRLGQSVEGEPVLTVGRPSLLFLHPAVTMDPSAAPQPGVWAVTGRAQGQFPVVLEGDGALHVHSASGVGMLFPSHAATTAPLAADALRRLTEEAATQAVAGAWVRFHAP